MKFVSIKTVSVFALKFAFIAPIVWLVWWWLLPQYAWCIGQMSGGLILHIGQLPIEAMRIESSESQFLNAGTVLVYTSDSIDRPFDIASLVSNLPPLLILVWSTPNIKLRLGLKAMLIGIPVITLGHIAFVAAAFIFQNEIQNAPEIPTGIGYVLLALPFVLWILLVHWQTVAQHLPQPTQTPPED